MQQTAYTRDDVPSFAGRYRIHLSSKVEPKVLTYSSLRPLNRKRLYCTPLHRHFRHISTEAHKRVTP